MASNQKPQTAARLRAKTAAVRAAARSTVRKTKTPSRDRSGEFLLLLTRFCKHQLNTLGPPVPEYQFDLPAAYEKRQPKKWRLDWAWPALKIGVEIDGGIWQQNSDGSRGGRHNHGAGMLADYEKRFALFQQGWRVAHIPTDWLKTRPVQVAQAFASLLTHTPPAPGGKHAANCPTTEA